MLLRAANLIGFIAVIGTVTFGVGQQPGIPEWQTAAGGKMAFDVASVRQNVSGKITMPNFPLTSDDNYAATGGLFSADFPLATYIRFAYKLNPAQAQSMFAQQPKWLTTDFFEIHARAQGNPTKDQMRLMMQSLLADRFGLAVHLETQQAPMLALTLVKPGKTGPKLRPHAEGTPCDVPAPSPDKDTTTNSAALLPPVCGTFVSAVAPNNVLRLSSRNTTMVDVATQLSGLASSRLGHPLVDQTGLDGKFDFTFEWPLGASGLSTSDTDQLDSQRTTFIEALQDQLGLKLVPVKVQVEAIVIDRVERPSEN